MEWYWYILVAIITLGVLYGIMIFVWAIALFILEWIKFK